jgi:hypothetical protein
LLQVSGVEWEREVARERLALGELRDIVTSVADGTASGDVEWEQLEAALENEHDRRLIQQLRILAQISDVHGSFSDEDHEPAQAQADRAEVPPAQAKGFAHVVEQPLDPKPENGPSSAGTMQHAPASALDVTPDVKSQRARRFSVWPALALVAVLAAGTLAVRC